jgi:PPOX class probable F420-dependent enzyme
MLDPKIRDFAQAKNFGTISFHLADGSIGTHVMWIDADDEHMLINTEIHRAKYKAISANPKVTVAVWDADSPYTYTEVRGSVTGEVRGAEARAHIDFLSRKYEGHDYSNAITSERVILQITPDRQRGPGI